MKSGPLRGMRVVEFCGIGPAPMCGMLLADMGADVLLLERTEPADVGLPRPRRFDLAHRGKRSICVDIKSEEGRAFAIELCGKADVVIEGFRPGTMERLGLGPHVLLERNPRLIYGRMTGYGQDGPLSAVAGHDLNYISLTGALHSIGEKGGKPVPPLNLLGDYAGGSMSLAFGIACALVERASSGQGQVVDASMVEGTALLLAPLLGLVHAGMHSPVRGTNILDGGAPFYDTYRCADGGYIAFAAIELKFRKAFAQAVAFPDGVPLFSSNAEDWPQVRQALEHLFAQETQRHWCAVLEHLDGCVTPVLSVTDAAEHHHNAARRSFVSPNGVVQPAPAPRLMRTPGEAGTPPAPGEGGWHLARQWGVNAERLSQLRGAGVLAYQDA